MSHGGGPTNPAGSGPGRVTGSPAVGSTRCGLLSPTPAGVYGPYLGRPEAHVGHVSVPEPDRLQFGQYVRVIEAGAEAYPPSRRDPLPRGESYPVNRWTLDAALRSARVPGEALSLIYFLRGGQKWRTCQGRVVDAYFRAGTSDGRAERVELRVYAVPTPLKRRIATALGDDGLGRVAQWIADITPAGNAWRASDHYLVLSWAGRNVQFEELHGRAARPW
jgi:hypothetical protein